SRSLQSISGGMVSVVYRILRSHLVSFPHWSTAVKDWVMMVIQPSIWILEAGDSMVTAPQLSVTGISDMDGMSPGSGLQPRKRSWQSTLGGSLSTVQVKVCKH